ncbi:hypothetical protein ES332_D13G121600v1 [Gossypium tomentosum]|uniref:Uncharacterized protein n=1 Tax=Gossypium tomentosum TaxID=34277 RepID=A0A5D2HW60_GOSTO|nr:hypothetical protein ES332_D13G121600v1 [Gossypium tomentosum]
MVSSFFKTMSTTHPLITFLKHSTTAHLVLEMKGQTRNTGFPNWIINHLQLGSWVSIRKSYDEYLYLVMMHLTFSRYYELKPDDPPYAAKFYDCCGAENPEALGCTTSFHVSYDDD